MSEDQVQEITSTKALEGMEKQFAEELLFQGFHEANLCTKVMIIHPYLKFLPYMTENEIMGQDWMCGCFRCMKQREADPKPQNEQ